MTHAKNQTSPEPALGAGKLDDKLPATVVVYRGVFSEWGWLFLTIALAAGAYHLTRATPWATYQIVLNPNTTGSFSIGIPLLAILPVLSGLKYLHALFDERYFICEDYVMEIRGMLRWKRYSTRANYVHIRGIEIDESLMEQLFGIGDLKILTGPTGADNYPIVMDGIANPRTVKDIIQVRTNIKLKEFHGGGVED